MTDCYSTAGSTSKLKGLLDGMLKERGVDAESGVCYWTILATPFSEKVHINRPRIIISIELP